MKTVLYSLVLACLLAGSAQGQEEKKTTHKKHKVNHKAPKKEASKGGAEKAEAGKAKS